jgi:hypothetical protein
MSDLDRFLKEIKVNDKQKSKYESSTDRSKNSNNTRKTKINEFAKKKIELNNRIYASLSKSIKEKTIKRTKKLLDSPHGKKLRRFACSVKAITEINKLPTCKKSSSGSSSSSFFNSRTQTREFYPLSAIDIIRKYNDMFKDPTAKSFAEGFIRTILFKESDPDKVDMKKLADNYGKELKTVVESIQPCKE